MADGSVAVVGGGLGGLALAQSLLSNGVDCRVFERNTSFESPGRTVRIHCRPALVDSLRACVPEPVFDAFAAGQARADRRHVELDADLEVVAVDERPEPEVVVDTATARETLALGLGDRLELGRAATSVTASSTGEVRLGFADGATVAADVVVAADGAASTVRGSLPDAPEIRDVGLSSVYGTVDLDAHPELDVPPPLLDTFAVAALGAVKVALGVFAPIRPDVLRRHPSVRVRRYLFWNVLADPETLQVDDLAAVLALVGDASPRLADLMSRSAGEVGRFTLQTSGRGRSRDRVDGVILIGDAAHPMLPAALSASVALADAQRLGAALVDPRAGANLRERLESVREELLLSAFAKVHEAETLAGPAFGLAGVGAWNG